MPFEIQPFAAAIGIIGVSYILAIVLLRAAHHTFSSLESLASGIFLVAAYLLAKEAVHEGGWLSAMIAVFIGAALMEVIRRMRRYKEQESPNTGLIRGGFNNVGDGIFLAGAYASSFVIGSAVAIGILLGQIGKQVDQYHSYREARYTFRTATVRVFVASCAIIVGLLFTLALSGSETALEFLYGLAAGGLLDVALHDLLPQLAAVGQSSWGSYTAAALAVFGAATTYASQLYMPVIPPAPVETNFQTILLGTEWQPPSMNLASTTASTSEPMPPTPHGGTPAPATSSSAAPGTRPPIQPAPNSPATSEQAPMTPAPTSATGAAPEPTSTPRPEFPATSSETSSQPPSVEPAQ